MPKYKQVKVPAIEGQINADSENIKLYTAEIPAEVVAYFSVERALDVEGGFQRPLNKASARKIGMLMGGDKRRERPPEPNVHSGLLAYAERHEVKYSESTGRLTIMAPLHLLDGQTRAGGAKWAVENGVSANYTETVKVIVGATRAQIVRWFLTINMTARRVAPPTMLLNIATMQGVEQRRKSWIARHMITLATQEPFYLENQEKRIVSFAPRDGGVLSAYTLYKAINFILPDDLNKEGSEVEAKALEFASGAFKLYASLYPGVWGRIEGEDEEAKLVPHDCYEFTLLAAFARLYKVTAAKFGTTSRADNAIRKAWNKAGFDKGLPEGQGSGERAAVALAAYAAGEMGLGVQVAA